MKETQGQNMKAEIVELLGDAISAEIIKEVQQLGVLPILKVYVQDKFSGRKIEELSVHELRTAVRMLEQVAAVAISTQDNQKNETPISAQ